MREINAISAKKHLVVSTEPLLFLTEYKDHEQTGLQVCEAISLQTMCVKFCLNVAKLLICGCQECLDCIQNMGFKPGIQMMEIKVAEINAPLNFKTTRKLTLTEINAT